ncbi:MAG: glutaredoxin family protein [Nitrospinae bacterium]|nr:glutaredoxin family protein [Nitrospinota bacterium]
MKKEIELTMYSRPDCHLCDEMEEMVMLVSKKVPVRLLRADISNDAELNKRYGMDIPVLEHNGQCLAKHRAHEKTLLAKLEKLARKEGD